MTEQQFDAEKAYQASMACFRRLLERGTITPEDYHQIDTIMLEKYRPSLGILCSDLT